MKKITTLMIALLAGITSWAQCSADFYSYNNGNNNDVALIIVVSTINVVSIIIVVTNVSYPPLES